jgi:hypothetical protein
MGAMTSDQTEKQAGVVIPMWAWGLIAGAILMMSGWTASTLLALRDQCGVLGEKVRVLEHSNTSAQALPLAVARLEAKLDAVSVELTAVREDLRRVRPSLDVRGTR